MRMKNYSGHPFRDDGLFGDGVVVDPGDVVEVEDGYCHPRRAADGSRLPSIAERLCPGLEPADAAERKAWKETPESNWAPPVKPPETQDFIADGASPGVAAILAEKAKAEAAEKAKPKAEPKVELSAEKPTEPAKPKARRSSRK